MTPAEIDQFKEVIFLATQAGKKETSALIADIKKELCALKKGQTEQPYTNRQIERLMDLQSIDLKKHLDMGLAPLAEDITEIKTQTIRTNGRVGGLEKHRIFLWGAYTILLALGGIIIGLAILAIDSKIEQGINDALSQFEVRIEK
jgi:hypothetical protein